ncbi:LacI family DNA-binding transcriptional regulator [Tateyamaria sp. SN3-11]|uniref:LacI family DNA-binding transcriptional regulator n=1 Tax=Tateyamaria sp. SN3-11 TaxID=3092147 RepID=UPI0039ED3D76
MSQASKKSRPTMHDVAAEAGVSQMTVSRVLRGEGYFSQDVKARVADAATTLGYIHNRLASVQRGMENPMIGVVLPTLNNTVFIDVLAGINDTLAQIGMRPVFGVSEYSESEEETLVRDMLSWQPCGLILSGIEHSEGLRRAVAQSGVRVAEIMDVEGAAMSASFGISQQAAGADMARHFIAQGHRRVAYIGSQGGSDLRAVKRYIAFKDQLEAEGGQIIHERIANRASSLPLGRELTAACLSEVTDCDAIYFANDDLAAGGLMHCLSNGIRVPQDVALAGFNDLPFLSALPQRITTTHTPRYEMGAQAARYVAGADDGAAKKHVLRADLIVGDTT